MYEAFFGLSTSPFDLSPDPSFLFSSEKSREALASISHAVSRRKGFVVMTGEVGTGKTLILRCLFKLWEREGVPFAYFIGPKLSTMDFLKYIAFELGIEVDETTKGNLLRALYGFFLAQFEKDLTTVLIIDEAHLLPQSVLEEIRLLANFETAQQKLLQIILVGQTELDKKLDSVELRSLKQRIAVRCQLQPLCGEEIRRYIESRLELAGAGPQAAAIFPSETLKAISQYSLGIPRLINSICDQALMAAYARQVRIVPVEIIDEVAIRFRLDPPSNISRPDKVLLPIGRIDNFVPATLPHATPALDEVTVGASDSSVARPFTPGPKNALVSEAVLITPIVPQLKVPEPVIPVEPLATRPEAMFRSNQIIGSTHPFQLRRRLTPALRLSFLIGAAAVISVTLPAGVILVRHQKSPATAVPQLASALKTLPTEQAVSGQPASANSYGRFGVSAADTLGPRPERAYSKPAGDQQERLTPRSKVMNSTLASPVLKLPRRMTLNEPPLIAGEQIKELVSGKELPDISAKGPTLPGVAGGHFALPKLLSSPPPSYPERARTEKVEGTVMIDALLDETGKVTDMKVISGPDLLTQAALGALHRWKYEPGRLNGQAVATHVNVNINFSLH